MKNTDLSGNSNEESLAQYYRSKIIDSSINIVMAKRDNNIDMANLFQAHLEFNAGLLIDLGASEEC